MGREIKFRAWQDEEKKMYECVSVACTRVNSWISMVVTKNGYIDSISEPYVLMQYTGLKDCDGQELYEGDICELRTGYGMYGTKGVVGFETGEFFFTNIQEGLYGEFKIIGNIYENPEILESN